MSTLLHLTHSFVVAAVSLKGETGLPNSTGDLGSAMTRIIDILIYLIGSFSVIFIIVGGLQLIVSGGSPARIKQGRETIIYAAVGLVVAIASFAIVQFITGHVK